MGLSEYRASQQLELRALELRSEIGSNPFYSLLLAAMREADTWNLEALKDAFPGVHDELQLRYNSPGGLLLEEMGGPGASIEQEPGQESPQELTGQLRTGAEDQG